MGTNFLSLEAFPKARLETQSREGPRPMLSGLASLPRFQAHLLSHPQTPRTSGAKMQSTPQSQSERPWADAGKSLVLLDLTHAGGYGSQGEVTMAAAAAVGSSSPDQPLQPLSISSSRTVDPRYRERMGVSLPFRRGPSSGQCRAADGVRGGQCGGQSQRRPWEAGVRGFSLRLSGCSRDHRFTQPQPQKPRLQLGSLESSFSARLVWGPTCPRTLRTSRGCLQGGARDPLPSVHGSVLPKVPSLCYIL